MVNMIGSVHPLIIIITFRVTCMVVPTQLGASLAELKLCKSGNTVVKETEQYSMPMGEMFCQFDQGLYVTQQHRFS